LCFPSSSLFDFVSPLLQGYLDSFGLASVLDKREEEGQFLGVQVEDVLLSEILIFLPSFDLH
jgi:hypothetical protein